MVNHFVAVVVVVEREESIEVWFELEVWVLFVACGGGKK